MKEYTLAKLVKIVRFDETMLCKNVRRVSGISSEDEDVESSFE